MAIAYTEDSRPSIPGDRLAECGKASPTFKMLCNTCPYDNHWTYKTYIAMSLWSHALADAAEEVGFDDVAEYERWWANDWLRVAKENKFSK